jgi:hypothetical protein
MSGYAFLAGFIAGVATTLWARKKFAKKLGAKSALDAVMDKVFGDKKGGRR